MSRVPRLAPVIGIAGAALLVLAPPAAAANPVLDPEDDTEVATALAEATQVQGVCYGYVLNVSDQGTGEWGGVYASSSAGAGVAASADPQCRAGLVELRAYVTYTSEWSESEDSASWEVVSTVPGVDTGDVEDLGLSSGDLLDDDRSSRTLLDAVLALPGLATEEAGLPPLVLEPDPAPLPEGARTTASPGSDWLRENGVLLLVCAAAIGGGLLALVAGSSRRAAPPGGPRRPPRVGSFGPPGPPKLGTSTAGRPRAAGPPPPPTDPWRR